MVESDMPIAHAITGSHALAHQGWFDRSTIAIEIS